ncbi:hypothetical protein AMS68_000604 [Peltaster fructicola]|uniref:Kynureninase n=1 Tax=Peltaster fructicola TaxID=286661 RepID=A0A6H0XK23_9PEZI|nr:hypothetical protein AMS68_000604 [Peltaster fructicola]
MDTSQEYALSLDKQYLQDSLRREFKIPTRGDLRSKTLSSVATTRNDDDDETSTYLCGNSLGLQPQLTQKYFQQYLHTWASKGVFGHFTKIEDSNLAPWLDVDDDVRVDMAALVGASASEVAVMQTLTANLHLLMASFYKPTKDRYKIILEHKAFPSDHYAVESQIRFHDLDPEQAMVLVKPDQDMLTTDQILRTIDEHADETALLMLPGIQFYTGQYFEMQRITEYAQSKGILVGWDLAHAAGNVPVQLHEWNVDFAAWCTYKYLNCGPGSIGAIFVHERHFDRSRLAGWWGSSKTSRFAMTNIMEAMPGASGFQLSNPSVADLTAVRASLDVFKQTSIAALRKRSLKLTAYLENLLAASPVSQSFSCITPKDPEQRGAQLSLKLLPGLLDSVMEHLEANGVVVDERRPDVIRVAPAPLYNTFHDVWHFVKVFEKACATGKPQEHAKSIMVAGGTDSKGWSEIK